MIDWLKRWKREDTRYAERRTLYSRCKTYKVEETDLKYGREIDKRGERLGYPVLYRALLKRPGYGWTILSEHRKARAAQGALEYFAEHGHAKPKQTKASKAKKRQKAKRKANKNDPA